MIALTHAFSRKNAGDGLLVDLSREFLGRAGVDLSTCELFALDADSFEGTGIVHRVPSEPSPRFSMRLMEAVGELACGLLTDCTKRKVAFGQLEGQLRRATGIVAVGGGYMVTDSVVRSGGVLLNHYEMLCAAARLDVPSVYLPQSIGPLCGPVGSLVRRSLRKIDIIFARDDETAREIHDVANVKRCADLAVLKIAELFNRGRLSSDTGNTTFMVGREVPRAPKIQENLLAIAESVADARWAVQSDSEGSRSDRMFYRRLNVEGCGNLSELLRGNRPGVVVSVRLHGALSALMAGWPAIHLAYERKGWGAYQDLGIPEYVHDVRNFDPQRIIQQTAELHQDPTAFWDRIERHVPRIVQQADDLVCELRNRLVCRVLPHGN